MDVRVWTIKKAERRRINAFEVWCWRLLRVPWTARSNQSIPKAINPECSLEGLMLKLETPILWPPDMKSWLILEDPGFACSHVWMWELDCEEGWTPKNWCFWTVVLGRLLRVPWTAMRSNQSILKEISPGCSLERMMLKLKLQYFGWEKK